MPAPATGPARLARAFVVALGTVLLALGAHVLGGGAMPATIVLVPLAAVALAAAVPFSGRRIGAPGAVALLGLGQLGLHASFDTLGGMGCVSTADVAGHVHAVQLTCTAAPAQPAGVGSAMLALHVVATIVTALLIAGTDRALTWVATWLRPLVAVWVPVTIPAFSILPVKVETPRTVGRRDVGVSPDRGPPTRTAHVTLAA